MQRLAQVLLAPFHALVFVGFAGAFLCALIAAYGTRAVLALTGSK